MKRLSILLVALALPLAPIQTLAHEGHKEAEHKPEATKAAASEHGQKHEQHPSEASKSLTGEVVDTGCYLGHAARGAKHISCATKCIMGGMPMGLLTSDGALYLLTMNHDNADPYNKLKEMAGKTVTVTGAVMERSGMKGIDVTAFKESKPAAEPTTK